MKEASKELFWDQWTLSSGFLHVALSTFSHKSAQLGLVNTAPTPFIFHSCLLNI